MTLPIFPPGQDPGPNFHEVLRRLGLTPFGGSDSGAGPAGSRAMAGVPGVPGSAGMGMPRGHDDTAPFPVRHGTTICAVRYGDGVLMAGDRRATAGSAIAHRTMEKVHPADTHSGVAIAGAAGPALEMVRIFQLQLEHYEKVEGQALSLEGKANQLSQMVRANLPMALQGFVVVPLFAGYDLRRAKGRIFTYDPTGGRYEETDYHADGSGGRDARTTIKLGFRENMSRSDGIELCVRALWQAADEDSATGGPDAVRGIYPTVATITARGFDRVPESEVAEAFDRVIANLSAAEFAAPPAGPTDARAGAGAIPTRGPTPALGSGATSSSATSTSTGDGGQAPGGPEAAPSAMGQSAMGPPAGLGSLQKGLWP